MKHVATFRSASVIGPLGEPLTLEDLPPQNTQRWVPRRKAEVVAAVNGGLLTVDEAHARRVADLRVYLRQHHAERDLARLGRLVATP